MNRMLKWFEYGHLPEHLQKVSRSLSAVAEEMDHNLAECAEKTAGMRKLLEAKDCFVRAIIEAEKGGDKMEGKLATPQK